MENPSAKVRPIDEDRLSMISRMSQAVEGLPKQDIVELKSFAAPPQAVKDSLDAVLILLGYKQTDVDWKIAKQLMGKLGPESLQKRIAELDPESVTDDRRKRALEILSKYDLDKIRNTSKAAFCIYEWARAVSED